MIASPAPQRTFRTEFPDFPEADLPELPAGFEDTSWHNEACPSFFHEGARLYLYVDYAKPSDREHPDAPRYSLHSTDAHGCITGGEIASTDDWEKVKLELALRGVGA